MNALSIALLLLILVIEEPDPSSLCFGVIVRGRFGDSEFFSENSEIWKIPKFKSTKSSSDQHTHTHTHLYVYEPHIHINYK